MNQCFILSQCIKGTGKTFFIRYLINEIKNKSLIYVPPDLVNVSSIRFFVKCKNDFHLHRK